MLDALNARDIEALCAVCARDCVIARYGGAVSQTGRTEIRAAYAKMFVDLPENRTWSKNRMSIGDYVIDHEAGEYLPGGHSFEIVSI